MAHKKNNAPSTRHPKSHSLQKLHGVTPTADQMLLEAARLAHPLLPGDANHPAPSDAPTGT